jgi:hypothetical protein
VIQASATRYTSAATVQDRSRLIGNRACSFIYAFSVTLGQGLGFLTVSMTVSRGLRRASSSVMKRPLVESLPRLRFM